MAWTDGLLELMPDTVTIKTLSGLSTDGRGVATYTTGTSYRARKVYEQKLVRTFEGTEEVSNTTLWIASTSTVSPASEFELPNGTAPGNLLAIETYSDENGVTHSKAMFG
jgi:hypothetical protein